jgi:DNA-binding Lrp family transcriptional regulator
MVALGISELEFPGCRIQTVEQVIGGWDIIARIETPDIDSLARAITDGIREVPGVLDVVASWCRDGRDMPEPEPSGRPGAVDVVSVTHY